MYMHAYVRTFFFLYVFTCVYAHARMTAYVFLCACMRTQILTIHTESIMHQRVPAFLFLNVTCAQFM
jgi:hypothetical protein